VHPATHQNPKQFIQALYSVGREATPVLIDKSIFEKTLDVESPSITVICNAAKDGIIDVQTLKITLSLEGIALVLVPPFIAKILLDLPSLGCNKVFAAVLEAIGTFDKANKMPSPSSAPEATSAPNKDVSLGELPNNPIVDEPEGDFVKIPSQMEAQLEASLPRASKKPSVFARGGHLIKYLYLAQSQQEK
jgi:hypothetical protein